MATLTICRGLSGSGKSTWANSQNAIVVSRDSLREALFGDYEAYFKADRATLNSRENYITKVEHEAIGRALAEGLDVISDNTNIQMSYVNAIAKIGYRYDADVVVKVFEVSVDECVRRAIQRKMAGGRYVPESVIRQQAERFKPGAKVVEKPVLRQYTGTPGKPDAFMYDLDGTVYHMNGKRGPYDTNVEVDDVDEIIPLVIKSMTDNTLGGTMFAVAMSGRKEETREATEKCLNRDGIWFDDLFMRADDDNRSDDVVKHELFWTHVAPNYNVKFVLDDRDQVVRMWRKIGLSCLQVAEGEF